MAEVKIFVLNLSFSKVNSACLSIFAFKSKKKELGVYFSLDHSILPIQGDTSFFVTWYILVWKIYHKTHLFLVLGLDLITLSTASSKLLATSAAASNRLFLGSSFLHIGGNLNLIFELGDLLPLLTLITLSTESGEETVLESLSLSSVSGLKSSRVSSFGKGLATASTFPLDTEYCLTMGKHVFELRFLLPKPGFLDKSSLISFSLSFLDSGVSEGDFSGLGGVVLNIGVGFTLGVLFKTLFGLEVAIGVTVEVTTTVGVTVGIVVTVVLAVVTSASVLVTLVSWFVFLNCGIGGTVYFCFGIFGGSLIVLSALAWSLLSSLSAKFSVEGFGELNCLVNGYIVRGICLILGLVGHEEPCLILGELGTEDMIIRGEVGPGDKFVGDRGLDLGTKITEAKESSESTLVSL